MPSHPSDGPRRPARSSSAPAALTALLLGLALACGAAGTVQAAPPPSGEAEAPASLRERSLRDLGNNLCAPYPLYCASVWRRTMAQGEPFNVLISEACLFVYAEQSDDAGIACMEQGIRSVGTLPVAVLVERQFAPGEREANALWHDRPDGAWAEAVAAFFARVPGYCDNATPVIYDYFPCLQDRVRFFHVILKRYRLR
jgi:hypothetical protein